MINMFVVALAPCESYFYFLKLFTM